MLFLMCAKAVMPPGLPAEVARPLVQAAERVADLKPWEFMSDLHLIGVRDETTGELLVASVLGALREVFAVVFYRGEVGKRWILKMATEPIDSDPEGILEAMDFLKVEWTTKKELQPPDRETLTAAGLESAGRGRRWPRFQSCRLGWYPWFISEAEARQLTDHLGKVARFARLFQRLPALFQQHLPGEIPVVPAGDEAALKPEEIEWVPLVLKPTAAPELVRLSEMEQAELAALPAREHLVFEVVAPLMPEMAFLDEQTGRPCCPRLALVTDRDSYMIFACNLVRSATPLNEALGKALVQTLREAKVRPGALHVKSEALAAVLGPAGAALGVPVRVASQVKSADEAVLAMQQRFGRARPR